MAGIRDVARLAHVSTSTVSLVLNNNGHVSYKTRKKVETAMQELNYIPNELARNLYHSKTNIVGLILPDIAHPFFGLFAKYVEIELHKEGYKTMLCSTVHEENGEKEYIDMLNRQMMDGIIMGSHSLDIDEYNGIVRPIVSLDRYINETIPIVMSDHEKGGTLAAEELLRCGCRKVLQIMGNRNVNTPAHLHHYAFEKKLLEAGVSVCTEEMPWNRWSFEEFYAFVKKIYTAYPDIDAVYGADLIAVAYLKEAGARGRRIPEDLKIIAYDGTDVTRMGAVTITSVYQDVQQLAKEAVKLLVEKINGIENQNDRRILDVCLKKGETT